MKNLKVCTAIREKEVEDGIVSLIQNQGWKHSNVDIDDIVNEHRRGALFFIIEDSYSTILDLIELHNSCHLNFLPVIVLSQPSSKHIDWIKNVRCPEKYFHTTMNGFKNSAVQIIQTMGALRDTYQFKKLSTFRETCSQSFKDSADFRLFLNETLLQMLDLLYAERGSIMLLNEKNNLVIEASSKKNLIGMELEARVDSVSWTVINTMKPIFVENIDNDPRFSKTSGYAKDYFMSLPIFVNRKIAGVFNLSDKMVSLLFDSTDQKNANNLLKIIEPYLYIRSLETTCDALKKLCSK